jgi:hypothetical protein
VFDWIVTGPEGVSYVADAMFSISVPASVPAANAGCAVARPRVAHSAKHEALVARRDRFDRTEWLVLVIMADLMA